MDGHDEEVGGASKKQVVHSRDVIEGLQPVDPKLLEPFERAMTEEVIPAIVRTMRERAIAAQRSRQRIIW